MIFKNALKQIQSQNIEVWTAADEVRMALQCDGCDRKSSQKDLGREICLQRQKG